MDMGLDAGKVLNSALSLIDDGRWPPATEHNGVSYTTWNSRGHADAIDNGDARDFHFLAAVCCDGTRRAPCSRQRPQQRRPQRILSTTLNSTMANIDPVNLDPIPPLIDSYSFHSTLPASAAPGSEENKEGWIMGIDEAGRGRGLCWCDHANPLQLFWAPWFTRLHTAPSHSSPLSSPSALTVGSNEPSSGV